MHLRAVEGAEPTVEYSAPACFSKEPARLALVNQGQANRTPVLTHLEEIRVMVTRSRAEQGLPPTIQDTEVLERVAAVFRLAVEPARAAVPSRNPTRKAA